MTKGQWAAWVAAALVGCAAVAVGVVTSQASAPTPRASSPTASAPAPSASSAAVSGSAYHSRPDLRPPTLTVRRTAPSDPGLLLSTPQSGRSGLLISDDAGQPVWFKPAGKGRTVGNLRVDTYRGKKVLAYFDGVGSGYYRGEWHLLDTSYRQIATIAAGDGAQADIHDLLLRPDGTAIIECYTPVTRDLSAEGGSAHTTVLDSEIQQIDVATGKVLFDWHSLDHLPVTESYANLKRSPVDYMHTNTLAADPGNPDNVIVSARHLSQVFALNLKTGKIGWRVGGKHPTLKLTKGAVDPAPVGGQQLPFSFQHDAIVQPDGTLTVFDNGNQRKPPYSRAASFTLDPAAHTVTEINSAAIRHSPDIYGGAHGSTQKLPGGHTLVSWGTTGRATEYDSRNHPVEEITSTDSYRLLRQPWQATPSGLPAVVAGASAPGKATAYVSWNGATDVTTWQVLAGSTAQTLHTVATVQRAGFETAIAIPANSAYVSVRAKNVHGTTIGTSAPVTVRQ
ncbi:MAG TPA: arylsulfotransferase family protein [Mycobacteriales bacterium]|nr:arylsulfotransferase family protein [Mycobacteriales bacterium]